MFLIKKRKLVLDLFTCQQQVFDAAKPRIASQFFPDWWKQLKTQMPDTPLVPQPTMKRCMGFVDHFKHGIIIPMWSDFRIQLSEIGTQNHHALCSDGYTPVVQHSTGQRGGFAPADQYCNIKLESPWTARCNEDVYFKWEQPTWNMNNLTAYVVLPATVEFKYQHSINVHLMFPRLEIPVIRQINFGTPVVHLTPLTERELDVRHHMVTPIEYQNFLFGKRITFLNSYRTYRREKEKNEVSIRL
jgi:hypothetical protein